MANLDLSKYGITGVTEIVRNPSFEELFEEEMKPGLTISQQLDIYKGLIYTCVPLFRDEKLQQAYEVAEPYDVVPAIFDDNILAIQSLGDEILGLYGFADMINEVKNS